MLSHIPVPVPAPPYTGSGQTGREKLEEKRGASQGRRLMEDLPERLSPPQVRKGKDMSRAGQSFDYKTGISKYVVIWLGSLETQIRGEQRAKRKGEAPFGIWLSKEKQMEKFHGSARRKNKIKDPQLPPHSPNKPMKASGLRRWGRRGSSKLGRKCPAPQKLARKD